MLMLIASTNFNILGNQWTELNTNKIFEIMLIIPFHVPSEQCAYFHCYWIKEWRNVTIIEKNTFNHNKWENHCKYLCVVTKKKERNFEAERKWTVFINYCWHIPLMFTRPVIMSISHTFKEWILITFSFGFGNIMLFYRFY